MPSLFSLSHVISQIFLALHVNRRDIEKGRNGRTKALFLHFVVTGNPSRRGRIKPKVDEIRNGETTQAASLPLVLIHYSFIVN